MGESLRVMIFEGFVSAVVFALEACSISPATARPVFTGLMTTAREARISHQEYPQVVQAFGGIYPDQTFPPYIRCLGQSLAAQTERTDTTYTFTILDSPIVNAVATRAITIDR